MQQVISHFKSFFAECKAQNFAFWMASFYLIFSYLRPQAIYSVLDILPWTQLSIAAGLIYLIVNKRLKIQFSHVLVFIFLLVALASSFQSYYKDYSLSKISIIYIWLIEMLFFTSCIKTARENFLISILFFLILFKISLFGARTWIERGFGFRDFGIAGPDGFFSNSGELSLLMAMLSVMSIAFLIAHKPINRFYYLLPITAVMTVLAASSRGGQLALAGALLFFMFRIGKLSLRNLLLIITVSWLGFYALPDQQKERFLEMGEDNTSKSRMLYWEKGMEMASEHPWLGVGFYSFPLYFEDRYSYVLSEDSFLGNRSEVAHNSLVQVGSTMGYTGLGIYILMHLHCFSLNRKTRQLLKRADDSESKSKSQWTYIYSLGLDAAVVAYFIGAFFMSVAYYPYIYLMLMLTQVLKNSAEDSLASQTKKNV